MIIALACVLAIAVIAFILGVRAKDLPEPEPESPFLRLDERKAAIYENLRDLQFEYRVGKLSDEDYQNTKKDLQRELASVLAEVDALKARLGGQAVPPVHIVNGLVCASCGAKFEKQLKFCGECGKPMKVVQA
jgi:NADH pyrophosphatase NudC (nudix superfamily)